MAFELGCLLAPFQFQRLKSPPSSNRQKQRQRGKKVRSRFLWRQLGGTVSQQLLVRRKRWKKKQQEQQEQQQQQYQEVMQKREKQEGK
jgi:hypothetical protein